MKRVESGAAVAACRVLVALVVAFVARSSVPDAGAEWPRVPRDLELTYPRDHGAHPAYRTEWWYVTGQGRTPAGRVFGVQFTIFRVALFPEAAVDEADGARSRQVYAGHLAITDVASNELRLAERLRRGGSPLAVASESDMDVRLEDWRIHRDPTTGALHVDAGDAASGIEVELVLAPAKPLVLHGEEGYSRKGPKAGNASAYASFSRLALTGDLVLDGERVGLDGLAWFDQEFGSSVLGEGVVGWDWFGLHLDDGRDLMVFVLRREDGSYDAASAATLVAVDGSTRALTSDAFTLTASGAWPSPDTGAVYPNHWRLRVPDEALDLSFAPRVADCELVTAGSTGVSYWEGPVVVEGSSAGAIGGSGYAELTGYAGSMGGRL